MKAKLLIAMVAGIAMTGCQKPESADQAGSAPAQQEQGAASNGASNGVNNVAPSNDDQMKQEPANNGATSNGVSEEAEGYGEELKEDVDKLKDEINKKLEEMQNGNKKHDATNGADQDKPADNQGSDSGAL